MASVSGLSSTSSIYGSRNVISGLATGMDTESMIENAVSGIKKRISGLEQKRTKVGWQQEAYRSMISKMVGFSNKYASYTSNTNLLSPSFFNNAVKVITNGSNASKIAASGRTNSEIVIDSVTQLATAARASVGAGNKFAGGAVDDIAAMESEVDVSAVSGTLTIEYGAKNKIELNFDELEKFTDADELAKAINDKLAKETVSFSSGTKAASEAMEAKVVDGNIVFADKTGGGNDITISGAGKLGGHIESGEIATKEITDFTEKKNTMEFLSGKTMSVTLNGTTKTITLPKDMTDATTPEEFLKGIQDGLDDAFGTGKITVGSKNGGNKPLKLTFAPTDTNDKLKITSPVGEALGLGKDGKANYLDMGTATLEKLGFTPSADGKYNFSINGADFSFNKDDKLETVLLKINNDTKAGVKVSYSSFTNQFVFTAKETGANHKIAIAAKDGTGIGIFQEIADKANGATGDPASTATYTDGQNAKLNVTVNGETKTGYESSSNTLDIDGLKVTLNGTFDSGDAVTFTNKTDSDKIVDAVKSMVEDYNAMVKEIKDAYTMAPQKKSDGTRYEPLTDEDQADMSESAIKSYEEKAKQGILFADNDLSSLSDDLRSDITPPGVDGSFLRSIGIDSEYSQGLTTLSLDEEKLRAALDTNPDQVMDAFTKTKENGAATDGLMQSMKNTLDRYAGTTGAVKGILIGKAGSPLAPTSIMDNTLKEQMDNYDKEIAKWEDKLSDQVDRYTAQFSRLEQLTAQMNSQSSALMSLMGGNN